MKPVEIYIVPEEPNGMRTTPYPLFGDFINPVKFLMAPIGISGEQKKKWLGKKTLNFG